MKFQFFLFLTLTVFIELQNGKIQSKHNYIFISYEWVDHIAVYSYMFRPLSDIVRLYYFLL